MEQKDLLQTLKTQRQNSGLTQEQLAAKTGIPRSTIAKIEAGFRNTTLNTLHELADGLNFDLALVRKAMQKTQGQLARPFAVLNQIEINAAQIIKNYLFFQKLLPQKEIWPVLKANAYGHGIKELTQILKKLSITYLVVDSYYEALQIWEVNPQQKILLIGPTLRENFAHMKWDKLAIVVYDLETLLALNKLDRPVTIHLKINTGMNRQGINLENLKHFLRAIKKSTNLTLEGVLSHLADADGASDVFTRQQIKKFQVALQVIENKLGPIKYKHLAATAGSVKSENSGDNVVRLGLGLYGYNPLHPKDKNYKKLNNLRPVLRFTSKITNILDLKKGDTVSYSRTFAAPHAMTVAVLPVGYFDFYDRSLSNRAHVKIGGKFLPILGRICMNLVVIDLKNLPAKLHDSVEIISPKSQDQNSIINLAKLADTIPYETLVKINSSIRRVVV